MGIVYLQKNQIAATSSWNIYLEAFLQITQIHCESIKSCLKYKKITMDKVRNRHRLSGGTLAYHVSGSRFNSKHGRKAGGTLSELHSLISVSFWKGMAQKKESIKVSREGFPFQYMGNLPVFCILNSLPKHGREQHKNEFTYAL